MRQQVLQESIHTPFFGHQSDCQATKQNEWRDNSKQWLNLCTQNSLTDHSSGRVWVLEASFRHSLGKAENTLVPNTISI